MTDAVLERVWKANAIRIIGDGVSAGDEVHRLRAALKANSDVTFDIPADGDHCCHNLYHVVRPRMADWLAERLGGTP